MAMANHEPLCIGTKFCLSCKRIRHVLVFASHKTAKDGLFHICRECKKSWDELNHIRNRGRKKL